jgi:broad specificity phosphatase PhoE
MRRCPLILVLFLAFLTPADSAITVLMTRHAEVVAGSGDPSLTPQGSARAKLLADMLTDVPLDAVFVSSFKRTQQTAAVVASRHHLAPRIMTEPADLASAIRARQSGIVLVVGHSNTIPQTITLLGGPTLQVGDTEFDNLFVITLDGGHATALRLRYGSTSVENQFALVAPERTSIVEISFIKHGGFAGPMTRVQGTIHLKDSGGDVTGDSSYHRQLPSAEADLLRAGAAPQSLQQAGASDCGGCDMEQYDVTVKTADGKTHQVTLTPGAANPGARGASPATEKFLEWLQAEAQRILTAKMKSK